MVLLITLLDTTEHSTLAEVPATSLTWNFDADSLGILPKHFIVGTLLDGRAAGEWKIIDMKEPQRFLQGMDRREFARVMNVIERLDAPSPPHVLAQLMTRGFEHSYKIVLIEGTTATNLDLEVSFLAIAGEGDMGGGLIWRAQDDRNYYLTRANPLEQNIRLYRVVDGVRHKLVNFNQIISVRKWNTLRVVVRGNHFQVVYNGQPVIEIDDHTFMTGLVGLWTKSDAVTYFDDLQLRILK
jgi:hypothetical protein